MSIGNFSWKEKKNHGVEVGFHCTCLPSRISRFLHSLFWKYEHSMKKKCKESFWMYIGNFSWKKKKIPWCRSGIPLLLSFLSNFEIFLHSLFWKYEHSIKKNCKEFFWMYVQKFSWKKKKIYAVEVGFHCSLCPLRISSFFFIH